MQYRVNEEKINTKNLATMLQKYHRRYT